MVFVKYFVLKFVFIVDFFFYCKNKGNVYNIFLLFEDVLVFLE